MIHTTQPNGSRCGGTLIPIGDLAGCPDCGLVGVPYIPAKRGRCHCVKCGLIRYRKHEAAPGSPCETQPGRLAC